MKRSDERELAWEPSFEAPPNPVEQLSLPSAAVEKILRLDDARKQFRWIAAQCRRQERLLRGYQYTALGKDILDASRRLELLAEVLDGALDGEV